MKSGSQNLSEDEMAEKGGAYKDDQKSEGRFFAHSKDGQKRTLWVVRGLCEHEIEADQRGLCACKGIPTQGSAPVS